jgi:hypothetical protein
MCRVFELYNLICMTWRGVGELKKRKADVVFYISEFCSFCTASERGRNSFFWVFLVDISECDGWVPRAFIRLSTHCTIRHYACIVSI